MNLPECTSKNRKHTWEKWETFEKKYFDGLSKTVIITSQKRQCETCGLTQFLNDEAQE